MLDEKDREWVGKAKQMAQGKPRWSDHWFAYVLVLGGLGILGWQAVESGRLVGVAGAFMLGIGISFIAVGLPMSKVLWRLARLVVHAEERGAFGE